MAHGGIGPRSAPHQESWSSSHPWDLNKVAVPLAGCNPVDSSHQLSVDFLKVHAPNRSLADRIGDLLQSVLMPSRKEFCGAPANLEAGAEFADLGFARGSL